MASSAHVARRLHMEAGKVESVGGPRIQQAMLPPKPPQHSPYQHLEGHSDASMGVKTADIRLRNRAVGCPRVKKTAKKPRRTPSSLFS